MARQTLISLLATQGRWAELQAAISSQLATEPQTLGQSLLRLNRLFARTSDKAALRGVLDTITTAHLELPEAHYLRALAAQEMRDLPAARDAIRQALAIKPDWEAAGLFRVQLIEDRAEAMAALQTFIEANPQATEARHAYARALVADKRYAEARREFDRLLEQTTADPARHAEILFATAVLSLQLNDADQAEKHLLHLLELGHAETDKIHYYLGQIADERKQWDAALQWFNQVEPGEHYLPARLQAAHVLAKQGQLAEARRYLALSDVAPEERPRLIMGEAQLLRETSQLTEAYEVLTAGLKAHTDHSELLYELALLAEKLGRLEEMEARLRQLLALRPDHAHALNALGYSLADRKLQLDEARELIGRALELAPNDPFILDSQGWVMFRLGDLPTALETLRKAFATRPDPEIAAHLGEVLWVSGLKDEARQIWQQAQREHPDNTVLTETIQRLQH
jgi:tetratricopeptide (TPR) repeat protein